MCPKGQDWSYVLGRGGGGGVEVKMTKRPVQGNARVGGFYYVQSGDHMTVTVLRGKSIMLSSGRVCC